MRDGFLSYAGEDADTARHIVEALDNLGFDIWFAPLNLRVGQKLLESIERGMRDSRFGILLISKSYLAKGWTSFELDTLLRSHIEDGKSLLPLWLGVTKEEIAARHSGLAGIFSLKLDSNIDDVVTKLATELSGNAPTLGVVPQWESPKHRFLQGRGEIKIGSSGGPAASLWELVLHSEDTEYPLFLGGERFSKDDLLLRVAQLLPHLPDIAKQFVTTAGYERLWAMCKERGLDPKQFE
jgi:hypothetical protein